MLKYRGFSSLSAYCANRSHGGTKGHGDKNTRCPLLSFDYNNMISPNNADVSTKMRYAKAIKFAASTNKSVAGRVTTYKC